MMVVHAPYDRYVHTTCMIQLNWEGGVIQNSIRFLESLDPTEDVEMRDQVHDALVWFHALT